ncbi:protein DYAD-like [Mangifera indica]|uniref:protein DYAD-like n=1 Tax=Mangifera indica TaxID=29780 RepID=UPI001CFA8CDF|nr:protein DYAD-like [Mangifera indica]
MPQKYTMEPEEELLLLHNDTVLSPQNDNVLFEPSKNGRCWTELKSRGMLNWASRKKVQFLRNDEEDVKFDRLGEEMNENRKRKRATHVFTVGYDKRKKKKKGTNNLSYRWSKERYKMAEVNMLKIMKEKEAVFGKPILRPALRSEARRLIGDTGLLDHLLKHMAGKVAPGGKERFRRRHNADGAMEYWLESADLVNIRKEAGVDDPYWTPPPGWSPGDNPTQDPVCAMEFKRLKEALAKMERDMQQLLLKKQEDDGAIVNTPTSCITSQNFDHDSLLLPLKEMYTDLMNKKAKIEEQMMEVSHSLCGMEVLMEKLKSSVEDANKAEATPVSLLQMGSTMPSSSFSENGKKTEELEQKMKQTANVSNEDDKKRAGGKTATISPAAATKAITAEDKAAKIERLKSGFRICRPQGSFLWPDMAIMSPDQAKEVVPIEDLVMVPTPPSVSSSSTSPHHLLLSSGLPQMGKHSISLVKPLPERRPIAVTLTNQSLPPGATTTQFVKNTTTAVSITTKTKTSLINLNVVPSNLNEPSTTAVSCLQAEKQEGGTRQLTLEGERKERLMKSEQKRRGCSTSSSSCLSKVVGTWLAFATPNPTLHKRG